MIPLWYIAAAAVGIGYYGWKRVTVAKVVEMPTQPPEPSGPRYQPPAPMVLPDSTPFDRIVLDPPQKAFYWVDDSWSDTREIYILQGMQVLFKKRRAFAGRSVLNRKSPDSWMDGAKIRRPLAYFARLDDISKFVEGADKLAVVWLDGDPKTVLAYYNSLVQHDPSWRLLASPHQGATKCDE